MELIVLTEFQEKLLELLRIHGPLKREKICELLGFSSYQREFIHYYPTIRPYKSKQHKKMQLYNRRTTVYDNLDKLLKKGLILKYQIPNGKRGRPPTYWKLQERAIL